MNQDGLTTHEANMYVPYSCDAFPPTRSRHIILGINYQKSPLQSSRLGHYYNTDHDIPSSFEALRKFLCLFVNVDFSMFMYFHPTPCRALRPSIHHSSKYPFRCCLSSRGCSERDMPLQSITTGQLKARPIVL